jgi:hypothetical protein
MSELDDLRAKLKKRQGRPGFKANVAELERRIEVEETGPFRDKETGLFVTSEFAFANPDKVERVG